MNVFDREGREGKGRERGNLLQIVNIHAFPKFP